MPSFSLPDQDPFALAIASIQKRPGQTERILNSTPAVLHPEIALSLLGSGKEARSVFIGNLSSFIGLNTDVANRMIGLQLDHIVSRYYALFYNLNYEVAEKMIKKGWVRNTIQCLESYLEEVQQQVCNCAIRRGYGQIVLEFLPDLIDNESLHLEEVAYEMLHVDCAELVASELLPFCAQTAYYEGENDVPIFVFSNLVADHLIEAGQSAAVGNFIHCFSDPEKVQIKVEQAFDRIFS